MAQWRALGFNSSTKQRSVCAVYVPLCHDLSSSALNNPCAMEYAPPAPPAPPPVLSREAALRCLTAVSAHLDDPSVMAQLDAVKAAAGADALLGLMLVRRDETQIQFRPLLTQHRPKVLPVAVQLLGPLISQARHAEKKGTRF